MKKIFLSLLVALPLLAIAQKEPKGVVHDAKVVRVLDGDTIAIEAKWLIDPLKKEIYVRIYGVDTPEKGFRAKCEDENKRALEASAFTKQQIESSKKHQVFLIDWDKYGGRVLGDLILDGKSLRKMLIDNNLAREYYGEAKQPWCKK